jgi:hypothetical protein
MVSAAITPDLANIERLMTWIYLADCAFCIYHNVPPRMMQFEFSVDLVAPIEAWDATSPDLYKLTQRQQRVTYRSALSLLLNSSEDISKEWKSYNMTPFDMFVLIHGMQLPL